MPAATLTPSAVEGTAFTIDQVLDLGIDDRDALLEVQIVPSGFGAMRFHSRRPHFDLSAPAGAYGVEIAQVVQELDGSETRNYGYVWFTDQTDGESGLSFFREAQEGVLYDHSAIDHGPDGPVDDGDPNVYPLPASDPRPAPLSGIPTEPTDGTAIPDPTGYVGTLPTMSNTKAEMKDWLRDNGVVVDDSVLDSFTKGELLAIIELIADVDVDNNGVIGVVAQGGPLPPIDEIIGA